MPAGDGTGPNGTGPMTGRAAGYCAGYAAPGFVNRGGGRGMGFGGGRWRGRGWRHRFYATGMTGWQRAAAGAMPFEAGLYDPPVTDEQQLGELKNQAEHLEGALGDIRRRIEELQARHTKD
ncbi:MAG: DUF5320 domain-containing protein [Phycisphaerae bacterium]